MQRPVLIFAICLPLAILTGFMLSDPLTGGNLMLGGVIVMIMALPLLISYHHRALIWMAGSYLNLYLLKGQPHVWMALAGISFVFVIVSKPLGKGNLNPVWTRDLFASVVAIFVVVMVTAKFTGGISLKAAGSSIYGGKKYILLLAGMMGFFALTSQRLLPRTVWRDVSLYTLGPITAAFSNFAYMLGPSFYVMFLLFPVDMAMGQASSELSAEFGGLRRFNGFGPAGTALVGYCLLRWGFQGLLELRKPWRLLFLLVSLGFGLLGGFRSTVVTIFLLLTVQFLAEGLHRTRYLWGAIGVGIVSFGLLAAFSDRLPMSIQRGISVLPIIRVDPTAELDAKGSTEWRLEMWALLVKDIPKYFWLGKGYGIVPADLYFAEEAIRRGYVTGYEVSIKAGDYHSGPLSVIIPFGIWGVLAVLWFFWAALKVMWNNLHYGAPEFKRINTFLYSLFVARLVFFLFFFGAFEMDFWHFCSVVGISLCVNGGMRRKPQKPRLQFEAAMRGERRPELAGV